MKSFREILISAIALTVIAGAVTAALAGTNALTKGPIETNTAKAEQESLKEVIADATFDKKTYSDSEAQFSYYVATKGEETVGYVFVTESVGKSAGLKIMTGIKTTGEVCGVKIVEQNETAGYAKKVEADKDEKDPDKKFFKRLQTTGDKIDGVAAVSGATKTSNGIKKAVKQATDWYALIAKEGGQL